MAHVLAISCLFLLHSLVSRMQGVIKETAVRTSASLSPLIYDKWSPDSILRRELGQGRLSMLTA